MSQELTPFNPGSQLAPPQGGSGMLSVASSRQAQEVQAAMVIAKKFPRDENSAYQRIMQACKRKGLAEAAAYAYPRGGTTVTGPSIRMAEVLAQNWGNMDFGIIELEQVLPSGGEQFGKSIVMAYAWDLETNTRQQKVFEVPHKRDTKRGATPLTDGRDIYEMVANQGARRLRACILGVIPGDVVDAAMDACDATLKEGGKNEPIIDRARKIAAAFLEIGVNQAMLEKRLGHKMDAIIEQELVTLRKIFASIRDGQAKREDFFELNAAQAPDFGDGAKPADAPKPPVTPAASAVSTELFGGGGSPAPAKPTRRPAAGSSAAAPEKPSPKLALKNLMNGTRTDEAHLLAWVATQGNTFASIEAMPDAYVEQLVAGWQEFYEQVNDTPVE